MLACRLLSIGGKDLPVCCTRQPLGGGVLVGSALSYQPSLSPVSLISYNDPFAV